MLIQLSFSTIFTFLDEIVRIINSEYIILYGDHFSRIPLYTYISFNGGEEYCDKDREMGIDGIRKEI